MAEHLTKQSFIFHNLTSENDNQLPLLSLQNLFNLQSRQNVKLVKEYYDKLVNSKLDPDFPFAEANYTSENNFTKPSHAH